MRFQCKATSGSMIREEESTDTDTNAMQPHTSYDDRELFLPPNFLKKAFAETCSALIFVIVMWFLYPKDESVPTTEHDVYE